MEKYSKIKVFRAKLEYWQDQLSLADNEDRRKYCEKMVKKHERMVEKPEEYAGY